MIQEKLKAASIHLAISAFIIACFLSIVLLVWYPAPFPELSGLNHILAILIGVDLVLGPLLTFIIFKKQKPSLKFDLSVIASVQLAALIYGAFSIFQGHPAYIVYAVDRFELVPAQDVAPEKAKYDEFKISKLGFPKLAYAKKPEDSETRNKLLFEVLSGQPDIERRPEYYEPFDKFAAEAMRKGLTQQQLGSTPENRQKLEAFLEKHGKTAADYAFLPLVGKEKDVLWVWDKASTQPVGTLDIDPWHLPKIATNG
ncbi:TfpX/TfpZ family type IV pilin accessory protein [Thiothrix nivea]|uniref:Type IV pilin accessory protein n=1 Tax=Thiothrix nivea (strain ATCC 35100 / DSM 5205 / JP2) TaxID=870187 RepID=A0A656HDM7_THINJ|nr:TfpX/TfpZ family type IV pilin accessory protein [Thiothrix nivea]EIJ34292.1 type IV pilin accessory protein [Thiothrix nivea DSM 5205]